MPRWQDQALHAKLMDETKLYRRVERPNSIGFDGLSDLLLRARGASVLDIGCNKGYVAFDFVLNGARLVHGCDIHAVGMEVARHWFAEFPECEHRFEVVDLSQGPKGLESWVLPGYDIVLFLGVYHKLRRVMDAKALSELVQYLGARALTYLAWRGYEEELSILDGDLGACGLRRVHTSILLKPAAIWKRQS